MVDDVVIQVRDQYYILATSSLADSRTRVLKCGDTFAVFDRYGDVHPIGAGHLGLYHADTRFLSRLALRVGPHRPLLLSSAVTEDNALLAVDLTNPDLAAEADAPALPRDTVHVFRGVVLDDAACHVRLRLRSFALAPARFALVLTFDADFVDIFEVRGTRRPTRGTMRPPVVEDARVELSYRGLDDRVRRTAITFDPAPAALEPSSARWDVELVPGAELTIDVCVACRLDDAVAPRAASFDRARAATQARAADVRAGYCDLTSSNDQFNDWLGRSSADLRMMTTETAHGAYPYAGVPWFSTPFGRDGLITALSCLWVNPSLAGSVLRFLAATQATTHEPVRDAEPGKILHEMRGGEMAALREVPFERYYGSVDATPLFVVLAGAYHAHTGDRALTEAIFPHVERALGWIDAHGDADGDGFVEYVPKSADSLANQGWKDSVDSVFHADGAPVGAPVALCEVQAYVFGAWRAGAALAAALGHPALAAAWQAKAEAMRDRFERTFWCEDLGTYALALDRDKRLCRVRASNAGHALVTGIASPARAAVLARTLLDVDMFSGWGVRTVSSREVRYNPMSYHNGSIWPHDNALIAAGLARYGHTREALQVFSALFDASRFTELTRLPELYCGFARRTGEGPTLYPVACAPQAWAAAAPYLLLASSLGLTVQGDPPVVRFDRPVLPRWLDTLRITGLRVGTSRVDLELERHELDVGVNVLARTGPVDVIAVK